VPLYAASDRDSLERTLEVLKDRHLVLIDTAGLGPRDPRLADQATLLSLPRVKKILMLAANAQAESLERSVRAYAANGAAGAILTKLDEAVKLGAALDTILRHRLTLHFVANGQRVPEDLHPAHARMLAHRAMKAGAEGFDAADLRWKSAA
jgi:flagellar biosynthesis protein FlhF